MHHPTIIVAEDDPGIREFVAAILESELRAHVLEAHNGQRVLDLLADVQPSLILMDVRMPVLDGITAAQRIKASPETADIPIVAMSADVNRQAVLEGGCCAFLAKPFDVDELLNTVSAHIT